jgi:hypothetical protein
MKLLWNEDVLENMCISLVISLAKKDKIGCISVTKCQRPYMSRNFFSYFQLHNEWCKAVTRDMLYIFHLFLMCV